MNDRIKLRPYYKPSTGIGKGRGKRKSAVKTVKDNTKPVNIPQAKTIEEANQLAVSLGLTKDADFTGLDVIVANETIQELAATKSILSINESLDFLGTIRSLNKKYQTRYRRGDCDALYDLLLYKGKYVSALAWNEKQYSPKEISWAQKELKLMPKVRWSPLGTGTIRGVASHEIGHYLDSLYGLRNDARIQSLFSSNRGVYKAYFEPLPTGFVRYTSKMSQELSEYANANLFEFIAEAWSEYRNNPSPRPLAKEVGDRIVEIARGRKS